MPELSKLFVTIGAKTDQFEKGMKRVAKRMKGVAVAMVAIGAAITAAIGKSVKDFAKLGDEIQKMSLRTGFSTEALSELKFAAEISGASIESLEKAVKRMSSALVDADNGLLETKRAFDELGLSATKLLQLNAEEAFFAITGALGGVESALVRAALAQDIFGRAGTQLLPLIAQGAEGIEALRQKARDLGISFSQDAANAAADFNDALTELNAAIEGIKITIGTELAPVLTDMIGKFTEGTQKITEWTKANPLLTDTLVIFTSQMGLVLLAIGGLILATPAIIAAIGAIGVTAGLAAAALAVLLIGIGAIGFGISGLIINAKAKDAVDKINIERTKALAGETNILAELLEEGLAKGYIKSTEAVVDFIDATKRLVTAEESQIAVNKIFIEQTRALAGETNNLAELLKEGLTKGYIEATDAVLAFIAATDKLKGATTAQPPALRTRRQQIADVFRSVGEAAGGIEDFAAFRAELFAPGGALFFQPKLQEFGQAGEPIIIENNIIIDGEVIAQSVNDIIGPMVGDRSRVEAPQP